MSEDFLVFPTSMSEADREAFKARFLTATNVEWFEDYKSTAARKDVQSDQASPVASLGSDRLIGTHTAGTQAPPVDTNCPVCHGLGWRCEAHSDQPMDHDPDCAGHGVPCDCNE